METVTAKKGRKLTKKRATLYWSVNILISLTRKQIRYLDKVYQETGYTYSETLRRMIDEEMNDEKEKEDNRKEKKDKQGSD